MLTFGTRSAMSGTVLVNFSLVDDDVIGRGRETGKRLVRRRHRVDPRRANKRRVAKSDTGLKLSVRQAVAYYLQISCYTPTVNQSRKARAGDYFNP